MSSGRSSGTLEYETALIIGEPELVPCLRFRPRCFDQLQRIYAELLQHRFAVTWACTLKRSYLQVGRHSSFPGRLVGWDYKIATSPFVWTTSVNPGKLVLFSLIV